MNFLTNRFITSEKYLHSVIKKLYPKIPIIDYAIENNEDKESFKSKYYQLLKCFPNNYHALKFSSINFCYETADDIINEAKNNECKIMIDMENDNSYYKVNWDTDILKWKHNKDYFHVYKTYQMYRKDGLEKLKEDLDEFEKAGIYHGVKLVRGAYLYEDKDKDVLCHSKEEVDKQYDLAMNYLLRRQDNEKLSIVFATHNKNNFQRIQFNSNVYHASLMGFHHDFNKNNKSMVYVPFGPLLKVIPYLTRRLYENNFIYEQKKNEFFAYAYT
jgi:proline dehydrogenase